MDYVVSLILIAVSTALINNMVFHFFVGCCPYIGVSRRLSMAVGMGLAVTFVTVIAATLSWVVTYFVLIPGAPLTSWVWHLVNPASKAVIDLTVLGYVIYIFLIAGAVQLVEMYIRKFFPPLYKGFGVYLPLITTNCVILFVCIEVYNRVTATGPGFWDLGEALTYSFFAGAGFAMAITIMAGIREELALCDVPVHLRGPGITLIIAGILSLAFMGFTGMDKSLKDLLGPPSAPAHAAPDGQEG